jgi:hypothetical protein
LEFANEGARQAVCSALRVLWHFKQLPKQAGSTSIQLLQRGQQILAALPETSSGNAQFVQTSRGVSNLTGISMTFNRRLLFLCFHFYL